MGSTMANFTNGVSHDARALYTATPGSAVIAWTGYDAPAGAETGRVWEVATSAQATAGGAALVPFLAAVRGQPPDSGNPIARHSEYFDEGTALDNLSTIVSGGTPSPDQPRLVERWLEAQEDVHDGVHGAIDGLQDLATIDRLTSWK